MRTLNKKQNARGNSLRAECKWQRIKSKEQRAILIGYCFLLFAFCLLPFASLSASGGDDHTHADAKLGAALDAKTYFTSEANSDKHELFLKYQPITIGEETTLQLFISEYTTNKALDSVTFKITSKEDKNLKFIVTRAGRGYYEIKVIFPEKKVYSLSVSFTSQLGPDLLLLQNIEPGKQLLKAVEEHTSSFFSSSFFLIGVGIVAGLLLMFIFMKARYPKVATTLLIVLCLLPTARWQPTVAHEGHDDAGKKGNNFSNMFDVPKETQFLFDVLTKSVQAGSFTESTKLFGTIIPSSNGQAVVQSPQTGKITSLLVKVGQKVERGQVLATIEPAIDAGSLVNFLAEHNNVDAEIEAAKKEYDRLKAIEDIAAKRDVAEAEARYKKAKENKKLFENLSNGNANNSRSIYLKSPITGIVSNFTYAIGATVNANEILLTITNLSKVYVEAQVFDRDAEKVNAGKNFVVECATTDVHKTAEVKLLAPAQSINPTNQTQRVIFEMENPDGEFKIGEFVNVRVFSKQNTKEIALPNSAISEINGRPVVFIKNNAEQYSVSYISIGQNNGTSTVIQKGVEEMERVVVNATYQMKMIYLNQ